MKFTAEQIAAYLHGDIVGEGCRTDVREDRGGPAGGHFFFGQSEVRALPLRNSILYRARKPQLLS